MLQTTAEGREENTYYPLYYGKVLIWDWKPLEAMLGEWEYREIKSQNMR